MKKSEIINLSIFILLILSIGLCTGYGMGYYQGSKEIFPSIRPIDNINPGISTIKLTEYSSGTIKGVIDGNKTRIAYSPDDIQTLEIGEAFSIPVSQIKLGAFYETKDLAENVQFIASKNGKYYYHVLDKRAFGISPKNRLTFENEETALKSGFVEAK